MIRIAMALLLALPVAAVAGDKQVCTHAKSSCTDGAKLECVAQPAHTCDYSKQVHNRDASVTLTNCPYVKGSNGQVSLDRALCAAVHRLPNALPVEVSYEFSKDRAWYEVELLADGKLKELRVCAQSGTATEPKMIALAKSFVAADHEGQAAAPKLTMSKVLKHVADKHPHSRAVEAELELNGERLVYEVRMLCSGEMKEVSLDANNGTFLKCACDQVMAVRTGSRR